MSKPRRYFSFGDWRNLACSKELEVKELKLRLKEQQAEINRLREALLDIIDLNPYYLGTEIFGECVRIAEKALNGESEEK